MGLVRERSMELVVIHACLLISLTRAIGIFEVEEHENFVADMFKYFRLDIAIRPTDMADDICAMIYLLAYPDVSGGGLVNHQIYNALKEKEGSFHEACSFECE